MNIRPYAVAAALSALLAAPGRATLYSAGGGYQYTVGDKSYWGHDAWAAGNLRLDGGWYPFAQASLSTDSFYDYILAPGVGIEKGVAGLGKGRVGYTYYQGDLRDPGLSGAAHGLEVGANRAFTPSLLVDLAYRMTTGDLLSGVSRELDPRTGGTSATLLHSVVHQAVASATYQIESPLGAIQCEGGFSAARGTGDLEVYSENVGVSAPLLKPDLRVRAAFTLTQIQPSTQRAYGSFGLSYSFAGRLKESSDKTLTDRVRKH